MICLFLGIAVVVGRAEQIQKVSPNNVAFTVQPFSDGDSSGPPTLDPTVPVTNPVSLAVVPEPTTIAMLVLGAGCAGAFTALRRRRRG
jgi:PEP-CTERM motif